MPASIEEDQFDSTYIYNVEESGIYSSENTSNLKIHLTGMLVQQYLIIFIIAQHHNIPQDGNHFAQMYKWTKIKQAIIENNLGSNELSLLGKRKYYGLCLGPLRFPLALSRYLHPVNEKKLALADNLLELLIA